MRLGRLGELSCDGGTEHLGIVEDGAEFLDRTAEVVGLRFELDAREARETPEWHVEDVCRLDFAQVEDRHQALAGCGGIVGLTDELDDLVDVEDRGEESLD